jgi:hypothetical protein
MEAKILFEFLTVSISAKCVNGTNLRKIKVKKLFKNTKTIINAFSFNLE